MFCPLKLRLIVCQLFASYLCWLQCPGNPHTMCVHVNIFRSERYRWKSFSPPVSIYMDNSVSAHASNAITLNMAVVHTGEITRQNTEQTHTGLQCPHSAIHNTFSWLILRGCKISKEPTMWKLLCTYRCMDHTTT